MWNMSVNLFNYCPISCYEDELLRDGLSIDAFYKEFGIDGIEQFVYTLEKPEKDYGYCTVGAHLNYWTYWMDFWLRKNKRLRQQFRYVQDRRAYFKDALSREEWLAVIRRNINAALSQNPEYLVWHVSECNTSEIFTWIFNYSDKEVLDAAAEVFNAVADEIPDNVTVLFENLWWPGLRLTNARYVKCFFDSINRKNVGIMLDTGHLMNTNCRLKSEAEGADYILRTCDKLGAYADLIKGVHLSCSLSGEYQMTASRQVPAILNNEIIWKHISSIDQHRPFKTKAAKKIIDYLNPHYITHELAYNTLADLREKLPVQLESCR